MRARNIKPGFYRNEQLAECSPWARLLFPGLWMLADREGRLEYRPKRWKAEIFPYDNIDTPALFEELEANGLVRKYEVNGLVYVWIPHFRDHQNPHKNEAASEIPPFLDDKNNTSPVSAPEPHQSARSKTGAAPELHQSNPADSLIPDSLNPESPLRGFTRGGEAFALPAHGGEEPAQEADQQARSGVGEWDMGFQQLVDAYPEARRDPVAAWPHWLALKKARRLPGLPKLLNSLTAWEDSDQWRKDGGQYIPLLSSWLAKGRWAMNPPRASPLNDEAAVMAELERMGLNRPREART